VGTTRKQASCAHEFQAGFNQRNGSKDAKSIRVFFLQEEDQAPFCEVLEATPEKMGQGFPDN